MPWFQAGLVLFSPGVDPIVLVQSRFRPDFVLTQLNGLSQMFLFYKPTFIYLEE